MKDKSTLSEETAPKRGSSAKRPAFTANTPRFTRGVLWVNCLFLAGCLVLVCWDLWQGRTAWKMLPVVLVFSLNAWMNWQALKNSR